MRFSDTGMILMDGWNHRTNPKWHKKIGEFHLLIAANGQINVYLTEDREWKEIILEEAL